MPQTLTHEWKESLGENWQAIQETWLHRLANLTLTAYNSKYQNSTFKTKRDCENGYKDSGLRINMLPTGIKIMTLVGLRYSGKHFHFYMLRCFITHFLQTKYNHFSLLLMQKFLKIAYNFNFEKNIRNNRAHLFV